tara:strand:+ start:98 stop:1837 length:1740 start_codon:yes stop_codon:yes gene_type:complete
MKYRSDIDVLRTIAVLPVIFFHLGFFQNGYLGVDVFFVISGFLITGIIYTESIKKKFTILNFYERRIRRILPLVSSVIVTSLFLFIPVMLPDDLENFAQSVIATNFFSNNILLEITTSNYWDITNEYKPLMHTWSLAIEEQFYLLYPFIFIFIKSKKKIISLLILLSIISLALYFSEFPESYKFYYLPFRFFELSTGGIVYFISRNNVFNSKLSFLSLPFLVLILSTDFLNLNDNLFIPITILLTSLIILTDYKSNVFLLRFFENKLLVFFGKISFGLYMWHQIIFAFYRYTFSDDLTKPITAFLLISLTFILSIISFYFVERPFRNKKKFSFRKVFIIVLISFIATNILSFWMYSKAGIVRDIPELSIKSNDTNFKKHSTYNDQVRILNSNKEYNNYSLTKILVIGDSFARDWINVLKELRISDSFEIIYIEQTSELNTDYGINLVKNSDIIFVTWMFKSDLIKFGIPESKTFCVGTKNFGHNNGIFYNYNGLNYFSQKTKIGQEYIETNDQYESDWGENYINIISYFVEGDKVPVFTSDSLFISQDTRHFTRGGARYFAKLIEQDFLEKFENILNDN